MKQSDLQEIKDEDVKNVVMALTNGVGERPYWRRNKDGQVVIYVADDQEYCRVELIDHFNDEKIAEAICDAGEMIYELYMEWL